MQVLGTRYRDFLFLHYVMKITSRVRRVKHGYPPFIEEAPRVKITSVFVFPWPKQTHEGYLLDLGGELSSLWGEFDPFFVR